MALTPFPSSIGRDSNPRFVRRVLSTRSLLIGIILGQLSVHFNLLPGQKNSDVELQQMCTIFRDSTMWRVLRKQSLTAKLENSHYQLM